LPTVPATWIFQANPNRFDLDGFFAAKPVEFKWLVTRVLQSEGVESHVVDPASIGDDSALAMRPTAPDWVAPAERSRAIVSAEPLDESSHP
jgi:hypothetical protein